MTDAQDSERTGGPRAAAARPGRGPLDVFFEPDRIAVIGASKKPGGVGRSVFWNLEGGAFHGVGRLCKIEGGERAEFALVVGDRFQRNGVGRTLLERLLAIARDEHVKQVYGYIIPENEPMKRLCRRLGFSLALDEDQVVRAETEL